MTKLQTLENQPCTCVACPDCSCSSQSHVAQSGKIAKPIGGSADIDACPTCLESGIVKTCPRCEAINCILDKDHLALEAA